MASATGVFASVLVVLSVLWAAAVDGVGFSAPGTTALRPTRLPTALGLYTFCFCGHAVFPTLYTSMKEKRQFPKVWIGGGGPHALMMHYMFLPVITMKN